MKKFSFKVLKYAQLKLPVDPVPMDFWVNGQKSVKTQTKNENPDIINMKVMPYMR